MLGEDLFPSVGHVADGFAPRDRAKLTGTLQAGSHQWMGETKRGVHGPLVMVHLGAKGAAGKGMLRVPRYADRFPIRHLNHKPASIRAVIGTDRSLDLSGHENLPIKKRRKALPYYPFFPAPTSSDSAPVLSRNP
jgi:hypothetical protein